MAASFWCDKCMMRFGLPQIENETQDSFVLRLKITIQEPCPRCGTIADPCRGQYKETAEDDTYR